ncbi:MULTISPECIES: hypothetical protein [Enterococcaceae]|uniref:hypothetical protein n=1 Tax=Enterococcaceae TaxID=81852 RepID=UPI001CE0851B|nr:MULTISPECIES: hypothetical protein [Enterococcaceae]MDT2745979.1 hypothetical protein [Vagococcus fluvialis]
MKGLREYQRFDANGYFEQKELRVMASEAWNEYSDGQVGKNLGTKYKCVIATDNTAYKNPETDNTGEQVVVKVEKNAKDFKKFARVTLVNPSATIYGQFQNELSVKADDVEFLEK